MKQPVTKAAVVALSLISTADRIRHRLFGSLFLVGLVSFFFTIQLVSAQTQTLDFEAFSEGDVVTRAAAGAFGDIVIHGENANCPTREAAVIFDSDCPGGCSGDDPDLGSPNESFGGPGIGAGGASGAAYENATALGNLLIVHQGCGQLNGSPVADPKDTGGTSAMTLTFPSAVTLYRFTIIDLEPNETQRVELFDAAGASLGVFTPPATGNNGVAIVQTDAGDPGSGTADVSRIAIARQGSGGLDNVVFEPMTADLWLDKVVDEPAPDTGEEVTFTVTVTNDGPHDATGVAVTDRLPADLNYVSSDPAASVDGSHVTWNIGTLAVGESKSVMLTARADSEDPLVNVAEVTASDLYDPDSTPDNDVADEDDQDDETVTPGESSGGGDGGIESDGNMASKLAQRLFHRRQDALAERALHAGPAPTPFLASVSKADNRSGGASRQLLSIIPDVGPQSTIAHDVTPFDLLGITNATSVLAVDYLRVDGRRMAALFSATSAAGVLYDHTKATCDRLAGGRLEDVRIVSVQGAPFVLSKLMHPNGDVDYAISFVAYRYGSDYVVDSRFAPDQYDVPENVDEVVNLQVWSVAPDYTRALVENLLTRMAEGGTVTFNNGATTAPGIFVVDGRYEHGQITLRLANRVGPTAVTLYGSLARTEQDADNGLRTPFEHTLNLPAPARGERYVTTTIDVGAVFDAVLTVQHTASGSLDQIYHADGAWSYAAGKAATVERFATEPHGASSFPNYRYTVERGGHLDGRVTDWASLFRYLRPDGRPVDLTAYRYLEFSARGQGTVQLVVEKDGIDTWDQFATTFALTPESKTYRVDFDRLHRMHSTGAFTADDVTLLAFYLTGNGRTAEDVSITVDNVTFGGLTDDPAGQDLPVRYVLEQNYPNPFNPSTEIAFTLQEAAEVSLTVYDLLGRRVAVLVEGLQQAGRHVLTFDAAGLPSGLYLYRLRTPDQNLVHTMSLIK